MLIKLSAMPFAGLLVLASTFVWHDVPPFVPNNRGDWVINLIATPLCLTG